MYDYMGYLMHYSAFVLWSDHFLDSGAEICQIFCCFFGKLKKNQKDILKLTDLYHDRTDWSQIRLEFRISCVTGNMRLHFLVCASGENNGIFYFNWNQLHYWKHMAARLVILCQVQKLYTLVLQFYSSPCHIRYTNAKSS